MHSTTLLVVEDISAAAALMTERPDLIILGLDFLVETPM
jgi:hypothetical protein